MSIDAATFRIRFPALASATDETINYWLTDAARIVTSAWGDDQEVGTLTLAAHNIASSGAVSSGAPPVAGLTSFKSGAFSLSISDSAANQAAAGGYSATKYGRDFAAILSRNVGGPFLVGIVC